MPGALQFRSRFHRPTLAIIHIGLCRKFAVGWLLFTAEPCCSHLTHPGVLKTFGFFPNYTTRTRSLDSSLRGKLYATNGTGVESRRSLTSGCATDQKFRRICDSSRERRRLESLAAYCERNDTTRRVRKRLGESVQRFRPDLTHRWVVLFIFNLQKL